MQIVKFSDTLDRAFKAAFSRNYNAAGNAPLTWGGDGCNEIDMVDDLLVALKKVPEGTPLFCVEGNDEDGRASQFAWFLGSEADILAKLNGIK